MNSEILKKIENMNFSILEVHYNSIPSGFDSSSDNHTTLGYGFLYILNGGGIFTFGDKRLVVNKGQIIHGDRDTSLKIKITSEEPLEFFLIIYSCDVVDRYKESKSIEVRSPFEFNGAIEIENNAELVAVLEYLYENWKVKDGIEKIRLKGQFYEFLYLVMKALERDTNSNEDIQKIIQLTVDTINIDYMEPLNLELFAKKTGWSMGYFSKVFKNQLGISPIDYLIDIRMERAKVLLERSSSTIKEVAKSVGYDDSYYFSRIFKKKVGYPPSQYKKLFSKQ